LGHGVPQTWGRITPNPENAFIPFSSTGFQWLTFRLHIDRSRKRYYTDLRSTPTRATGQCVASNGRRWGSSLVLRLHRMMQPQGVYGDSTVYLLDSMVLPDQGRVLTLPRMHPRDAFVAPACRMPLGGLNFRDPYVPYGSHTGPDPVPSMRPRRVLRLDIPDVPRRIYTFQRSLCLIWPRTGPDPV